MLLIAPLLIFLSRVDVVPPSEPVQATLWDIVQQAASLLVALATLATLSYPLWRWLRRRYKARRAAEQAARQKQRAEEIRVLVDEALEPVKDQLGDVHRTTHVNGGTSETPTMLDKLANLGIQVHNLSEQVQQCITITSAVAANQAIVSTRVDEVARETAEAQRAGQEFVQAARAVFAEHGIDLPNYPD